MTRPIRLQLRDRIGFDLQSLSKAANGLGAVDVAQLAEFDNEFDGEECSKAKRVAKFRRSLEAARRNLQGATYRALAIITKLDQLRGKNLACRCELDDPCHADVLLEFANQPLKMTLNGRDLPSKRKLPLGSAQPHAAGEKSEELYAGGGD